MSDTGSQRDTSAPRVRDLGAFIREQRKTAQLSLRTLAERAGISNPYLSQIERGLRRPSADILQRVADALRISAESLYVQAGILEERRGGLDEHIPLPLRSRNARSAHCSRSITHFSQVAGASRRPPQTSSPRSTNDHPHHREDRR